MAHQTLPEPVSLGGRRVLFIMAHEAEYGPHLRARFRPVMTGVGPVEAALHGALALGALAHAGDLPDLVVSIGSAGSRTCPLGEVFQARSVSWRDMDASPLGFTKGVTPFLDHPVDLPLATPLALPSVRLSTGADIVSGDAYDALEAEMVDMETFALARVCDHFGVPLMGLRGISDGPGELAGLSDWTSLLMLLDERLAAAVDLLPAALSE
ncbi:5'-methylthioadenosine/S-adenosylhomocysteine nucleosidase [Novosphingobium nitrogenifigens DSM 19370]|uniref:5'-methylthioadenosine/S-adenosylhomocysteine nucleosidase n=1 Tax=Novosphingobium nitrogenifigens DSM 19370 TaxID=983920 RepID=F1Z4C9_9SPHN|nr:5'-methylthioadenosine/S-adenosylhomocysteine nucleosidase [Novosphingobium nitrogenifigens]EGD60539.1 5'-methylthioadenosine/S-adenosylhomocysteine nucleosidase [Novosphingobium nitrogenifigens DSM 19370]